MVQQIARLPREGELHRVPFAHATLAQFEGLGRAKIHRHLPRTIAVVPRNERLPGGGGQVKDSKRRVHDAGAAEIGGECRTIGEQGVLVEIASHGDVERTAGGCDQEGAEPDSQGAETTPLS